MRCWITNNPAGTISAVRVSFLNAPPASVWRAVFLFLVQDLIALAAGCSCVEKSLECDEGSAEDGAMRGKTENM